MGIIILVPGIALHPPNHGINITSIIYNSGFNNGSQTAMADMQNEGSFNSSCDPTGAHASGGQHPTPYCTGWTSGYISSWKPNSSPANSTVLSCTQCGSKLKPIIRFINGTNDGGEAPLNSIQNRDQFNPACDPTRSHTSDGLHTTGYCNGWTNGYISAWNTNHSAASKQQALRNVGSGTNVGSPHPTSPVSNTATHKKAFPTVALICNKSGISLICTYTNKT